MNKLSRFRLRPFISAQHERFITSATFIDGYLYNHAGALLYVLDIREPRAGNEPTPSSQVMYALSLDCFGLFVERKLFAAPASIGAPVRVDQLVHLNGTQRNQLRRLLVLLAMSVRAAMYRESAPRFSVKLHPLLPRQSDPMAGLRNWYTGSARHARDLELARRVADKRNRTTQQGVTKRQSSWPSSD